MAPAPKSIVLCCAAAMMLLPASGAFCPVDSSNGRSKAKQKLKEPSRPMVAGLGNSHPRKRRRDDHKNSNCLSMAATQITSEQVRIRNIEQLNKLRTRDRQSKEIDPKDLVIVYEDNHLVCVNKPAGVLCVPSEEGIPTLAQAVFENVPNQQTSLDKMVVHRLGMDTSGLVLFAKTMDSLREMNTIFRTRKIQRHYEVLVCGHLETDSGLIDMPLMRDYEKPPFMRISTEQNQRMLLGLDDKIVGKKLLEAPKASQTQFQVLGRETFSDTDLPVTRLLLKSVTGRTHQLNVHMAAIGHPIVGDRVYGWKGDALPNGGLEPNASTEDIELQEAIGQAATRMCVHAKSLAFQHPMLNDSDDEAVPLYFECETPF